MPTLEQIKAKLKEIDPTGFTGSGGDVKELPNVMAADEELEYAATGFYKNGTGILVSTNKRILFVNKGLLYGLKVEDFSYDKISSVQYETGMLFGTITIHASGNNAEIKNVPKKQAREFGEFVRNKLNKKPEPSTTVSTSTVADQLEKLASLKEKGLLTDEEFASEKKKLLGL